MLDQIKTSIQSVREEDLSIELEIGLMNEIILDLSHFSLQCQEERTFRKEFNNLLTHILNIYQQQNHCFDTSILSQKLQEKKESLNKVIQELHETQTMDNSIQQVNAQLIIEKESLEKIYQQYLNHLDYQKELQQEIHQYQNIDESQLQKDIKDLEAIYQQQLQQQKQLEEKKNSLMNKSKCIQEVIQKCEKDNHNMLEDIKKLNERHKELVQSIDQHMAQRKTINKDIENLEKKINTLDKIPDALINRYKVLKDTFDKRKTRLSCLLESQEDELSQKIVNALKKDQGNPLDQIIIQEGLNSLDQQAEDLLEEYHKIQKIGLKMKETH